MRNATLPCCLAIISMIGARWISSMSRVRAWGVAPAARHSLAATRQYSAPLRATTRWQIGDLVAMPGDSGKLINGTVVEHRGAGWYHVKVDPANNGEESIVRKARGTQLRPAVESPAVLTFDARGLSPPVVVDTVSTNAENGLLPPPPMIVDLDSAVASMNDSSDPTMSTRDELYLKQVANHASISKWVVFTDLHCAPSTLDTTMEVLACVHALAVERDAGVLFLGDFWHHRGTLRVDCLNAVLQHFNSWTVPMVMIPGNHDQVTLGGHNHGLTPLENAYRVQPKVEQAATTFPGPLVFSHPTLFAGALFVPHIRDHAIMESVLRSSAAENAGALFVHADVTGAYMNDMIVSTGGVPTSMFPPNKPIYSGHFHKAHVVKAATGQSIEYLGSPYEISLAEAGQDKSLVVLDSSDGWQCMERIPLSIGRRHFRVSSVDALLQLEPNEAGAESNVNDMGGPVRPCVRLGDRVVLFMGRGELTGMRIQNERYTESELEKQVRLLRKIGAVVEVREVVESPEDSESRTGGTDQLEDLSPQSTWNMYLDEEVRRETLAEATAKSLNRAGLEILEEIAVADDSPRLSPLKNVTELEFQSVSVEGFGPFVHPVTYPLSNRGLVLLRGTNRDGGSDSNGSGKSSIAMAALWCMTGSLDPRPFQDAKTADVVNDSSKTARVTLRGLLNGVGFVITRSKTTSRGGLIFMYDGTDLSAQSMKETQLVLEEKLGVSAKVLGRTMFHGQHALDGLLESTDASFKDELSLVVPMTEWQNAASVARKRGRNATKRANELEGMISLRSADMDKLRVRLEEASEAMGAKKQHFLEKESRLGGELETLRNAMCEQDVSTDVTIAEMELAMVTAALSVKELEGKLLSSQQEYEERLSVLKQSLKERSRALAASEEAVQEQLQSNASVSSSLISAQDTIRSVESTWSLDLSSGSVPDMIELPSICPTCKQAIDDQSIHNHELEESILESSVKALSTLAGFELEAKGVKDSLENAEKERDLEATKVASIEGEMGCLRQEWEIARSDLQKQLAAARAANDKAAKSFADRARYEQFAAKTQQLEAAVAREKESLEPTQYAVQDLQTDIDEYEGLLKRLRDEKNEKMQEAATMTELADRFGARGVQTFVLGSAVDALERSASEYLRDFSDGAQRLELELDTGDRITRRALVRQADGSFRERPLASLSGGQWRRCSLALTLGFADLVSRRGKLRSSICVLDEPLTHLDRTGRAEVGRVLRKLVRPHLEHTVKSLFAPSTIILILQDLAAEELEEAFDYIDEVVKQDGKSTVRVDERS